MMISQKITDAMVEYENENYDEVLRQLDDIDDENKDSRLVLFISLSCLLNLERYDEALVVINLMLEKNPLDFSVLCIKTKHLYFHDEEKKSEEVFCELETVVDRDNKEQLVNIADVAKVIGKWEKAIEYCDLALSIDGEYVEAIRVKASAAVSLDDYDLMSECGDKLYDMSEGDSIKLGSSFLLKLFSKKYDKCLEIINEDNDLDDEIAEFLKLTLYCRMKEDLNVEIKVSEEIGGDVDEGLEMLLDYKYRGIVAGSIHGVSYCIVENE